MNVLAISGQKHTKHGKPVVDNNGLPVFNSSVEKRIRLMKEILYIGSSKEDRKWSEISSECKLKVA